MTDVTPSNAPLYGTVQIVDSVPLAFARLVTQHTPRSVALSGGETAQDCYSAVRATGPDWSNVDVYFGDERFVPPDDPDSNEGMARRVLLDTARPRTIHSMYEPGPIEDAARRYDDLVRAADPIDLVHLGLGPDGHTASLFPNSPTLAETQRLVVAAGDAAHPHPRLTFTFPAIARARLVVVTVVGADKRDAIDRIRAGEDLPGARIRGERVLWLGDSAALGAQ
ncbi:MAG TPA: 6-phosphogluconolactonase [Acidimicrobiia bacterium]|nr:6-phosphogluconolactonase [Acidimicrobiia bacterium]